MGQARGQGVRWWASESLSRIDDALPVSLSREPPFLSPGQGHLIGRAWSRWPQASGGGGHENLVSSASRRSVCFLEQEISRRRKGAQMLGAKTMGHDRLPQTVLCT